LNKTDRQLTGFTLFAFTWAVAGLIHQLSFTDWRWYDVKGIVLTATILWVLFKPSSWQRFAVFLIVDWFAVAWTFPVHPNHIVFSWLVNWTLLVSLIMVMRKGNDDGNLATRWHDAFAPWLRIELCMLYFCTVFHKLNVAYFDIDWSCAALMHLEINNTIPLLPEAKWAQYCAIYGTLIIETSIPLLLLFARTRLGGVVLGMLFHGLLALHSHIGLFSFSSVMMALFTVFLPSAAVAVFQPPKFFQKAWPWALSVFGAVFFWWVIRKLLPLDLRLDETLSEKWKVGFLTYYGYLGVGLLMIILSLKSVWNQIQAPMEGRLMAYPILAVFPLLLFVNASGPYWGLKTQTSCSMFSNIHTENGVSNHLIVPAGIQITNWQYDLVEIIDSNESGLNSSRDKDLLVAYLDLRRIRTSAVSNFWVTFRRNGKNETFDMARFETYGALPPLGFLARRYFYFRPVERDPVRVRCKH
jgi:hypothetical protein